ncbi:hypothetical protein [Mucilaginibacter lappiensis]|uniref:YD repeat-containing protein n=1 Tax=Mucilaginibacter lappiensis TaxID=354630 RepID=A0A841JRQ5_9SPHI|nr:hypothetical protein [Mucilaginibacter lappiensis]MBB6130965.1 YD repeat-containing protein [Mucilaginibacter lappiensis]
MKKSLLLLSVSLLIVTSCKKDNNKQPDKKEETCSLTEGTYTAKRTGVGQVGKTTYTYDDKGRVSTLKWDSANDPYLDQYTYANDQITVKRNNGAIITYKLDNSGRIIKAIYADSHQETNYTYNTDGYLIQEVSTDGSSSKYTYTDGNLTSDAYTDSNPNYSHTATIQYTTDTAKNNLIDEQLVNWLPQHYNKALKAYFGKASKNLPLKSFDSNGFYENYTYDKDAKSNIVKFTTTDKYEFGYVLDVKYSCK